MCTCQHQCPCDRMKSSKTAAASICVPTVSPSCFLPLQEALQVQQVGLTQVFLTFLLLPQGLECARFICVLQEWSLYFTAHWLSLKFKPHWTSTPDVLWAHLPSRTLGLGSLMRGSDPLLLEKSSCNCNYPPVLCVGYLVVWVLTMLCLPLLLIFCSFILLLAEGLQSSGCSHR